LARFRVEHVGDENSTSVAGIAAAMPLSMYTTSSRRNSGSTSGRPINSRIDCGVARDAEAGAEAGVPSSVIIAHTRVNAANSKAKRPRPPSSPPRNDGTEAITTPTNASPSRTAVMRVRSTGSADSSAPHA
jgi:hypothetical protein